MTSMHRPYAVRGAVLSEKVPSVTTILSDMLNKPGIVWGAAKETALFAVLEQDKWKDLEDHVAIDRLRTHHRGIWDGRAAMGSLAHAVNELFINGENADLPQLIAKVIKEDPKAKTWKTQDPDDLVEAALGYVFGIETFWQDFCPSFPESEIVVRYPGLWIGQTDMRCVIDTTWSDGYIGPQDVLLDIKTTAKQEEDSGIYKDSWTLQLAMYGTATERVFYEKWEDKRLKSGYRVHEVYVGNWHAPERYCILHLRGNELYDFYEVFVTPAIEESAILLAKAHKIVTTGILDPILLSGGK